MTLIQEPITMAMIRLCRYTDWSALFFAYNKNRLSSDSNHLILSALSANQTLNVHAGVFDTDLIPRFFLNPPTVGVLKEPPLTVGVLKYPPVTGVNCFPT